ncbi:hypothetical protein ACUH92_08850 [Dermabacteraceae bacterium CCM 9520]
MGKQINLREKIRSNETAQQAQKTSTAPKPAPEEKPKKKKTPGPVPSAPKRLVRKEIQFEPELSFELTELRRTLNAKRRAYAPDTPTITDSILFRAALKYLIANQEQLQGFTEEELTASLLEEK